MTKPIPTRGKQLQEGGFYLKAVFVGWAVTFFPDMWAANGNETAVLHAEDARGFSVSIVGDVDLQGLLDRTFTSSEWKEADEYSVDLSVNLDLPIRYRLPDPELILV